MKRSAAATIAFLLSFHFASATIINVPGDQPTIQAGLDAAAVCDSVLVAAGTYYENITWPGVNGIKLIGSGVSDCFIDGSLQASVIRFEENLGGIIDTTTLITGFTIQNGYATGNSPDYFGGGIYCYEASPRLERLTLTGSEAAWYGGGLYCSLSNPQVRSVTITDNTAVLHGGGVYCVFSNAVFDSVTVSMNVVGSGGAGLYFADSTPVVTNSTIMGNTTVTHGGGIYCDTSSPTLSSLTISSNEAEDGAGMYLYGGSNPEISNVLITNNTANDDGGGICCKNHSSPTLTDVQIMTNSAGYGGGVSCHDNSHPLLNDVTIDGNTASAIGGGLYSDSYSNPSLVTVIVSSNDALGSDGGGLCLLNSAGTLSDVDVQGNYAANSGGGLHLQGPSSPSITNIQVTENTADFKGGGIMCNSIDQELTGVSVCGNTSGNDGGGICLLASQCYFFDGIVASNITTGSGHGAGIYVRHDSNFDVEHSTIAYNSVEVPFSGALYMQGGSATSEGCIFWGNVPHQVAMHLSPPGGQFTTSCSQIQDGENGVEENGYGITYWLEGNFDADPLFCDPENDDYYLHADSPCLPGSHPDGYSCGLIGALELGCGASSGVIYSEDFNHAGELAPSWTIESHSPSRSTPWEAIQDNEDDWSVIASQQQFQEPFDEWLISPVYDLSNYVDLELSFWHGYQHDASEAKVKYSINGGVSWDLLTTYINTTTGDQTLDVSAWADEQASVRFLFVFAGQFLSNASWNIDDFQLSGVVAFDDVPPTSSNPIPAQPMEGQWAGLTGIVGCTTSDPAGVDASTLQIRIDANGDGDYSDGGAEDWADITGFENGTEVAVTIEVTYLEGLDGMAFEFRAKDLAVTNDLFGYSGYGNAEGIEDDWSVNIFFEDDPPVFSDPIPIGQPEPPWVDNRTVSVGCTVSDSSAVDAETLQMRVDWNQSGDYNDPSEEWVLLAGYTASTEMLVNEQIEFPADGTFSVEFQASDTLGNGPAYSMTAEGITDDIVVRIDTTPPTASYLYLQGTTPNSATLLFSPTIDLIFLRYEIYYSLDSLVDESDPLWTDVNDPALSEITTSTTTVTGLSYGTPYWFRMRAVDELGHEGDWSNTVHSLTEGTPLAAVNDLNIEVVENGLLLTWSEPTEDIYGNTPVYLEGFDIHTSTDPYFTPITETRIATTTSSSFMHAIELSGDISGFYRIIALGCGSTTPPNETMMIPAGTFMMGQVGVAEPVREITLSHDFYLGVREVTNEEFLEGLQWAYEQGYLEISGSVRSHNQFLMTFSGEIAWEPGFGLIPVLAGEYIGQPPEDHPAKYVSWYGAACYCDWLSEQEGLEPFYQGDWTVTETHNPYLAEGYRLPTEAEWEYAARYNDGRTFPWGEESPTCDHANYDQGAIDCVGWTAPVGVHPLGLSTLSIPDMAGNMSEWVNDLEGPYLPDQLVDPLGWLGFGVDRIYRGGSWGTGEQSLRCADREDIFADALSDRIGFRVARTVNP